MEAIQPVLCIPFSVDAAVPDVQKALTFPDFCRPGSFKTVHFLGLNVRSLSYILNNTRVREVRLAPVLFLLTVYTASRLVPNWARKIERFT